VVAVVEASEVRPSGTRPAPKKPLLRSRSFGSVRQPSLLPRKSPAEAQVDELNHSMLQQEPELLREQQNQFELNQLRERLNRGQ
jgi:hypothetical protein